MVEGAGRARLLQQACLTLRVVAVYLAEDLQRNVSLQPRVARAIHLAQMPPAPSGPTISYGPNVEAAVAVRAKPTFFGCDGDSLGRL